MDKIFSDKINILKALAIVLVVSGHLEFRFFDMFPPYSFQLALFFFISGMLFKEKYLDNVADFIAESKKPASSLLFIFSFLRNSNHYSGKAYRQILGNGFKFI